ncbi:putative ribonuclease H-like domain-containing protein [Tanacetum coccineum]
MAPMTFSDSEVYTDKTCSKTCLQNYETLKKQCDDLIVKLNQTEFTTATYKRGLATVEAQLITYRKNEVLFSEEVVILKREVACKDYKINVLKKPEFKGLSYVSIRQESNDVCDKKSDNSKENSDESLVEEQVSQDKSSFVESSLNVDKETVFPVNKKVESTNPKNHEKPVKKSVRYMTGKKAYLAEYQDFNGGPVAFGGSKGYITGKGKIKTGKLDFKDVCFVKELQHFNLFSVSQIYDKKNKVLFTNSECLILSPEFKLPDANQVLLRILRQNNMYSFNLENLVPSGGLACLIAKATIDESNKWHRRLGHVNFKNLNKLVKGNLVQGLPSKIFQNDHTCVACQKGKQHKASFKAKSVSFFTDL